MWSGTCNFKGLENVKLTLETEIWGEKRNIKSPKKKHKIQDKNTFQSIKIFEKYLRKLNLKKTKLEKYILKKV